MTTALSQAVSELRTLAEIESAALKLDVAERAQLVQIIAASLDAAGEALDEPTEENRIWWAEIERRVAEIRQGTAVGRDGETVMREALARYS